MNKLSIKRFGGVVLAIGLLMAAAFASGVLRRVDDPQRLFAQAEKQARDCVRNSGFEYPKDGLPLGDVQEQTRRQAAYERCWTGVATSKRFASLDIPPPSELLRRARSDGFAAWRCVEEAGYRRTTPMPLNAPGGYPLAPASGHFAVGDAQGDLAAFYGVVSRCAKVDLKSYRKPDGTYADLKADGERCERHAHSGDRHSHGCFTVDEYPAGV